MALTDREQAGSISGATTVISLQGRQMCSSSSRLTRFHTLPAELILEILKHLRPQDYIVFALVHYSLLLHHGIVPELSIDLVTQIIYGSMPQSIFVTKPLPNELVGQIVDYLSGTDAISLILAYHHTFESQRFIPILTPHLKEELAITYLL
jgi:hypothetical protein